VQIVHREKLIVLGMMSSMPVAGVVWQTIHYLVGLRRLGYDVYYVEAGGNQPSAMLLEGAAATADGNGSSRDADRVAAACGFIARVMNRFDLNGQWALHEVYAGRVHGMSDSELSTLYREAALIINLHGGTIPRPEHCATGRLVYLETDPVSLQIELYHGVQRTIEFLEAHCAFFTFGENYGRPDCKLPVSDRFAFKPTRQPVVMEFWETAADAPPPSTFTTIGNWRQGHRNVWFKGEEYLWSKHAEFLKFLDLPGRSGQAFELALSTREFTEDDRRMLEGHGWRIRNALEFSLDVGAYRDYIRASRGEFTVAKDQNIRLRSGWFSDRAATYLASGRPVVTQETGFSNHLPTGLGLFAFSTMEEAVDAIVRINADYARHAAGARDIAEAYFDSDVVLKRLIDEVGLESLSRREAASSSSPPDDACSLKLRDHYTREYYLEDCGGFEVFKRTGGKALGDGRLQAMAMLAGLTTGGRALDLGCGRGELTYYLARQGFEVTAIDYSAQALRLAEECFNGEGKLRDRVRFVCDSVCTARLAGRYDVAIAADVIEHLSESELDRLYARMSEHLTPNGLFVVHTFPNAWYYRYGHPRRRRQLAAAGEHVPEDPRTPYERLMHINEQSPRVLRRQLESHFRHVLLWFAEPDDPGGSLLKRFRKTDVWGARDLFAIAGHEPIDVQAIRARLGSDARPESDLGKIVLNIADGLDEVVAAETFTLTVEVRNRGKVALRSIPPNPVYLSYHWLREKTGEVVVWDGERSPLLPPCESTGSYPLRVVAPPSGGRYVLRVTLVQEGVRWFDQGPVGSLVDVVMNVRADQCSRAGLQEVEEAWS
jgi:2-polyprenyl-3-methyl-5-hydroxy-6-metoxy-1,4-benzoquinol methylase